VSFQEFRSGNIPRGLFGVGMNTTIHFNFKLMLNTKRIKNKTIKRMLSSKFQPVQAPAA